MRRSVILVVLLIGWSAAQSSLLDLYCSGVHKNLNETSRNINIPNANRDTSCDSTLRSGWYTFGKNAHFPDTCTRTSVCSAEATFWTADELPNLSTPGPKYITICRSESDTGSDDDCQAECLRIQTAYCANIETIIYEFKPVSVCDVRYCYQEKLPCLPDEGSPTGSSPNCRSGFPFSILRNGTTRAVSHLNEPILSSRLPGVYAFCSIDCEHESCRDLTGDVYWHTNEYGAYFIQKNVTYDANRRILYSFLTEDEWIPKSNFYIHCTIIPKQSGNRPFNPLYTTSYYFGLFMDINSQNQNTRNLTYTNQKTVVLELSDLNQTTASLTVRSNIPIVCGTNTDGCFVTIQMEKEGVYNDTDIIRTIGCSDCELCKKKLSFQTIADVNNSVTWDIITTVNIGNRFNTDIQSIVLKTVSGRKVFGNFWKNLLLPTIQIVIKRANLPSIFAYSMSDPQISTFDGVYYRVDESGEYLVMENKDTLLRVHAYIDKCVVQNIWDEYCTRKLFIESVNELVIFDAAFSDQLEYKMLSSSTKSSIVLRFVNGIAELPTESGLKITSNSGNYFEIWTHFATMIQITKSFFGNYRLYPSKADYNKVTGLFGNYTGRYGVYNGYKSFSVTDQKSNRPRMNYSEYYYNPQMSSSFIEYCICTNQTGERAFLCPLGRIQQEVTSTLRRKRQANQGTDDIALSNQLRKFVQSTKTQSNKMEMRGKRQIGSSCSNKLNSVSLKMCDELGIINLKAIISSCDQDFINMGIDFSNEYVASSAEACATVLKIDDRFQVERKARSLQSLSIETLLSQLCYNNCSGTNGRCNSKAQCLCNSPYAGDDCSINTNIPPKLYSTVFTNDVCDKSTTNCKDLILSVDRILPNTVVNFNAFYRDENGNVKSLVSGVSGVEVYSSTLLLTRFDIDTHYGIGSSVIYYNISVQDGTKSDSIMYAMYNSNCHICDSPTNCYIKDAKCDIQGVCYNAGTKSPTSSNLACNPQLSKFKWT